MKLFLMASIAMMSLSAFAQDAEVYLDASCKVECVTGVTREITMSGYKNVSTTKAAYFDVTRLTRSYLERYIESNALKICERQFGKVITAENPDCLIFKN